MQSVTILGLLQVDRGGDEGTVKFGIWMTLRACTMYVLLTGGQANLKLSSITIPIQSGLNLTPYSFLFDILLLESNRRMSGNQS
jgi:hypothetical protein